MVERFHRQLKAALRYHSDQHWYEALPGVLLDMRATWKEDLNGTPAEVLYGQPLRLPREFLSQSRNEVIADADYVTSLRGFLSKFRPQQASRHSTHNVFVFKDLQTSSHVFLRNDRVHASLTSPYDGPFRVVNRGKKTFRISVHGREVVVSVDRLKPAFVENDTVADTPSSDTHISLPFSVPPSVPPVSSPSPSESVSDTIVPQVPLQHSGRRVRFPQHLTDYIV
ncbi:uncharacterized protein LOC124161959 [Ischnura elegans]|uniref:uncharacterized protein LOC124161959 n=1 Tax=Ischnura elegans TaxID=197161 RepID=UPI001ED8ADA6|nr:uncharacterized protein LOC124161959 [Ischnura elegans]